MQSKPLLAILFVLNDTFSLVCVRLGGAELDMTEVTQQQQQQQQECLLLHRESLLKDSNKCFVSLRKKRAFVENLLYHPFVSAFQFTADA